MAELESLRKRVAALEAQSKDTNKMVQHHDEDMYARKAFELTSKEVEDTMIVTFLGKAIAIFVAWHFSAYFRNLILVIFGASKSDKWALLWTDLAWCILMICMSPSAYNFLRKRGGPAAVSVNPSKSQTMCDDVFNFWGTATIVINMWAYKDVAVKCMNLVDGRPTDFFSNTSDEVTDNMEYFGKLFAVAFAINGAAAIKNIVLHWYLKSLDGGKGGYFARKSLKEAPTALGIGIVYYRISNFPLYLAQKDWFPGDVIKIGEAAILTVTNLFTTKVLISIMYWYRGRCRKYGIPADVTKSTTADMAKEEFLRMFVKSMPFVYAWCWSNFGYFIVFRVGFNCKVLSAICPGQEETQFFAQLYYAMGLTIICKSAIPSMKAASAMMNRLNSHVVEAFLVDDKDFLGDQMIADELTVSFCGIAIGWSWTNIAVTECSSNISATCPADATTLNYLWYFITVCVYLIVAIFIYHNMMEAHRLQNRCRKIISIEDGNGARLFSAIHDHDEDDDGFLDKEELVNYIDAEGISTEPFVTAAAHVDAKEEVPDGKVTVVELMNELEILMVAIKKGEYVPQTYFDAELNTKGMTVEMTSVHKEIPPAKPKGPTTPRGTKPSTPKMAPPKGALPKPPPGAQTARPASPRSKGDPPQMGNVLFEV